MYENILELHELDELKAAYNLMDERLDNQEIVSDEQLRVVMGRRMNFIRKDAKQLVVMINMVLLPLIAFVEYYNGRLNMLGSIVLAVDWITTLLFGLYLYRLARTDEYSTSDVKTLCEKNALYQKLTKWFVPIIVLFIPLYFFLSYIAEGQSIAGIIIFCLLAIPLGIGYFVGSSYRRSIIKKEHHGIDIDPETGGPVKIAKKHKGVFILLISLYSILTILANIPVFVGFSYIDNMTDLMVYLYHASDVAVGIVLILALLHVINVIRIPRRLFYTVLALVVLLAVVVVAVSMNLNIAASSDPNVILKVVGISFLAYYFYKYA
ncbi:MAG: hypothetical protein J6W43_02955 [Prevotella sp.]|nr:hypothetical protein [Prevotella sp.]